MRKLLFFILFSISIFGQTVQNQETSGELNQLPVFSHEQKMFEDIPNKKIVYDSGIGISIKYLNYDVSFWNERRPYDGLPNLPDKRMRMYGLYSYTNMNEWLSLGLTGHYAVLRKENSVGNTRLSGFMGGVIFETFKIYDDGLIYVSGATISANLFDFTSMMHNGQGVSASSFGFTIEPLVGLGYKYKYFSTKIYYAYQIDVVSFDVQNGPIDDVSVLLSGGQWCANITFNIPQLVTLDPKKKWELITGWKGNSQ